MTKKNLHTIRKLLRDLRVQWIRQRSKSWSGKHLTRAQIKEQNEQQ